MCCSVRETNEYPTARPIGIASDDIRTESADADVSMPTNIPWIDAHQHTQTLSYNDQQQFALSGCQAVVMIAANYHWSPYRPVTSEDVRFLWDLALKWTDYLGRKHPFETYTAIGIHTVACVEDCEELLSVLPKYCELDEVVAIGETGIEPVQYASHWPVEEQRGIVQQQMQIAHETDVPYILHTPTKKSTDDASSTSGWGGLGLSEPDPSFAYEKPKLEAVEIDIELLDRTDLPDEQVIVDHADPSIVPYVMESTDCYLGFSVSSPLKGVMTSDIAAAIEEYGPDRILVNSDMMGYRECDLLCMARTIQELVILGIPADDVRTVVYENPKTIMGLDHLE